MKNRLLPEKTQALSPLRDRLLSTERDQLGSIRYQINQVISWPKAVDLILSVIFGLTQCLVVADSLKGRSWLKSKPYLFEPEQKFLNSPKRGSLRRRYIQLLFIHKLLTLTRKEIDRQLKDMQPLSPQEEEAILTRVEEVQEEASDAQVSDYSSRFLFRGSEDAVHHTQGDLWRSPHLDAAHPNTATCSHRGTKRKYFKNSEGESAFEEYCRECGEVLLSGLSQSRICRHRSVSWVEGKEGQEAVCLNPSCGKSVPNPETYDWIGCGLEPFGDDPTQDELIILDQAI